MTSSFPTVLGLLLAASVGCSFAAGGNLLDNGDFQQGNRSWSLGNGWFEKPAGAGVSEMVVVDGEGRNGGKALKIVGGGKRGLAMQVFNVYPGKYRVTGWIKCEKLDTTTATVLCEWMSGADKWLRGDNAASITGTTDWKAFDAVVEAPEEARAVHLDLLTSDVNNGTAWFDDLAMTRVKSGLPAPQPPAVRAETPAGAEGCLQVTWDPKALTAGAMRVLVYCEEKPLTAGAMPAVMADSAAGKATVQSLDVGKTYRVAAALVNGDSDVSARSAEVTAKVLDRQAPRPGWLTAERFGKTVYCMWSPHLLDVDVKTIELLTPGEGEATPKVVRKLDPDNALVFDPARQYPVQLPLAEGQRLGVRGTDRSGNVGETGWVDIVAEKPANTLAEVDLWWVPPTENVARSAEKPATQALIEPVLMRGQRKGLQLVIRPKRDLHEVEVSVRPTQQRVNGVSGTAAFVSYVHLDANSIATPKEELVWPAPGEYPDEISADRVRDLPAGQAQPIYVELKAEANVLPGKWGMEVMVRSREGKAWAETKCEVSPVALPQRLRLPFVYWFTWGAPCKEFGVEERSADGWRVLGEIGKQMVAHGERVVVVPWSMVRVWQDAEGKYQYDFRDFDRFLKTFRDVGVDQLFCLSHVGGRTSGEWECPTMSPNMHQVNALATGDIAARLDAVDLLPALQAHIEKLGLIDKFRLHIADEPIAPNLESYKQLSARAHASAPKLKRIDAEHVPDLQGYLEDWVPQINYFEQWLPQFRKAQAAGNKIWFYVAWVPQGKYPNRMIDSSAIKPRVLHWLNGLYDTDGYLHWALNHWQIPLTSLDSPGDQYITWPSKRFVGNSSLRYEAEREGLEDCELMFMVRDRYMKQGLTHAQAQAKMEAIGREAVTDFQNYTRSWAELERVRGKLLRELGK